MFFCSCHTSQLVVIFAVAEIIIVIEFLFCKSKIKPATVGSNDSLMKSKSVIAVAITHAEHNGRYLTTHVFHDLIYHPHFLLSLSVTFSMFIDNFVC